MLIRYDAKYCSVSIPESWLPRTATSWSASYDEESPVVEIEEKWIDVGASASAYAAERQLFLGHCFDVFEVVEEGTTVVGGPGAQGLVVRYDNEDMQSIEQREIYLAEGPLLCILRLIRPSEESAGYGQLFHEVAETFSITRGKGLVRAETFSFLAAPENLPPLDLHQLRRVEFPIACVSLPIPWGWQGRTEGAEVVLSENSTELRLRRLLGSAREPGTWMAQQLDQLHQSESLQLLGWSQGRLAEKSFTALWMNPATSRWRTAASRRLLKILVVDQEPLEWTVSTSLMGTPEVEMVIGPFLLGTEFLTPEKWQTKPVEPWIDTVLEGPWTCTHAGLYQHPEDGFPILELRSQKNSVPLEEQRKPLLEAMRKSAQVLPGAKAEREELGRFRGLEMWSYRGDGPVSSRGFWVQGRDTLYSLQLWMRDTKEAEQVFQKSLENLRLPE